MNARVPSAILCARFRRCYPADLWCAASYQTRGHIVPFGVFWIYYQAIPSLQAVERIQLARGTAHAIALTFAPKDSRDIPAALRDDLRDAYLAP